MAFDCSRSIRALVAVVALSATCAGCQNRQLGRPQWFNPGYARQQQERAQQFDPYPEPDIAPYADGSRPRGYLAPVPETARARWFPPNWFRSN